MTFLEAVNRIMRTNGLIKGDDDDVVSFDDVQHNAAINLAMIATQDEVNDLASDRIIPYEFASSSISTVANTRTYSLPTDFVRFYGNPARLYYATGNRFIFSRDRNDLEREVFNFKTQYGEPNWWYWEPGTTKMIGFYQVPNAVRTYTFDYEKSVAVSVETDTLPFHTDGEAQAFCQCAGRRFKALFEDTDVDKFILKDPTYQTARARVMNLIKGQNPTTRYGAILR